MATQRLRHHHAQPCVCKAAHMSLGCWLADGLSVCSTACNVEAAAGCIEGVDMRNVGARQRATSCSFAGGWQLQRRRAALAHTVPRSQPTESCRWSALCCCIFLSPLHACMHKGMQSRAYFSAWLQTYQEFVRQMKSTQHANKEQGLQHWSTL